MKRACCKVLSFKGVCFGAEFAEDALAGMRGFLELAVSWSGASCPTFILRASVFTSGSGRSCERWSERLVKRLEQEEFLGIKDSYYVAI